MSNLNLTKPPSLESDLENQNTRLIVAYGNPGQKFAKASSNVAYIIIDNIVSKVVNIYPAKHFRDWAIRSKYMIILARLDPLTMLVKPRTYENKFDDTSLYLYSFYKMKPENFYIVLPDKSLNLGQYNISKIFNNLPEPIQKLEKLIDTKDYWKIRIGTMGTGEVLTETDLAKIKFLGEKLTTELGILKS
jgi:peptidyl-tRNA hydrolase